MGQYGSLSSPPCLCLSHTCTEIRPLSKIKRESFIFVTKCCRFFFYYEYTTGDWYFLTKFLRRRLMILSLRIFELLTSSYSHNVSIYMSFGFLQVFHVERESRQRTSTLYNPRGRLFKFYKTIPGYSYQ